MIQLIKEFSFGLVILALMVVGNIIYGPDLPQEMPSHFNSKGEVTDYMSRDVFIWIFPSVFVGIMVMISTLIRYSPQIWSLPNTRPVLREIYLAIGCLLASIHLGTLLDPDGGQAIGKHFGFGASVFLVVFGNIMGKAEPNFFIGLRLPWTLTSENNWNATHRIAGKLSIFSGVLLFIFTFFEKNLFALIPFVLTPFLVGTIYSFRYYLKNERPLEEKK